MIYQYKVVPSKLDEVKQKLGRITEYKDLGDSTLEVVTDNLTLATAIKGILEIDGVLDRYSQEG
ncbi:MAG: hypothetical protein KME49_27465 [Brasilonema octagenarum HA4186-MV1]|jgi:hypothetical protein|nr:hypothetical protein [Brasilonema octagenarum HA4186-MV1]